MQKNDLVSRRDTEPRRGPGRLLRLLKESSLSRKASSDIFGLKISGKLHDRVYKAFVPIVDKEGVSFARTAGTEVESTEASSVNSEVTEDGLTFARCGRSRFAEVTTTLCA
jgi:hypothetical protein